jgi:hypothetical protein
VGLQFWLLLEATPIDAPSEGEEVERDKNALECFVPAAPGLVWPAMPAVLTPDGCVDPRPGRPIGGDDLAIGDLLVFKNGVVHRAPGNAHVFRAALAFRAVPDADAHDRDVDLLLWFRDVCARDDALRHALRNDRDYKSARARWSRLGARACDRSRLAKIDRHDHRALRKRLAEFDFRPFGHGDVAIWAPITEWP